VDRQLWERVVREGGTLDNDFIVRREALYEGRNGKVVERFFVETAMGIQSFIFKPLTNPLTLGREQWAEQYLLPIIAVRTPRLLATASHKEAHRYWAIFEDLGHLPPLVDAAAFVEASRMVATLHKLPLSTVPKSFDGHSPLLEKVREHVEANWERLWQIMTEAAIPLGLFDVLKNEAVKREGAINEEWVVCHGDLHPSNVSLKNGQLIVIDWEYVQQNSVFWDLYNLLDITSPSYRRDLEPETRLAALESYVHARVNAGWRQPSRFMWDYHFYTAVYSAWILLLIDNDIKGGRFDLHTLVLQRKETCDILRDCATYLE